MKTAKDLVAAAKGVISEVALAEAEEAILRADVIVDVREGDEYREGHIGGAINIPRGLLEFMLSSDPALQDRGSDFLLYCKNSGRSALAARTMQEMGYLHVRSIAGGFDGWKEAEKAITRPATPEFN